MIGSSAPSGFGRRSKDPSPPENASPAAEEVLTGENRRVVRRARTLLAGKLILGEGLVSRDCVIRDLSVRGARLRIDAAADLPPMVSLLVVREGLLFEANVIWRRGDQAGLTFVGQHDLRGDVDSAQMGARALWLELAAR